MAGFRKAKAEQAALKLGLYGPQGSGKTFTALLIAEGLAKLTGKRIAFVDTEHGTDFYCQNVPQRKVHPDAFDFDAIYTRSLTEVLSEVRKLKAEQYGCIVVDSMTHLWEAARASYTGPTAKGGQIPFHAWGNIKKPYKDLMTHLLNLNMHVIICGRQGNDFQKDEDTGELTMVGYKMKAEGETPYEPHILMRMEVVRKGEQSHIRAFAEKDRTGILQGQSIINPTFDSIAKPLLGLLGGKQAHIPTEDEVSAQDAEALREQEDSRVRESKETLRKFKARFDLCDDEKSLDAVSKEITAALKQKMVTSDVQELRESFGEHLKRVRAAPPKAPEFKPEEDVPPWEADDEADKKSKASQPADRLSAVMQIMEQLNWDDSDFKDWFRRKYNVKRVSQDAVLKLDEADFAKGMVELKKLVREQGEPAKQGELV